MLLIRCRPNKTPVRVYCLLLFVLAGAFAVASWWIELAKILGERGAVAAFLRSIFGLDAQLKIKRSVVVCHLKGTQIN